MVLTCIFQHRTSTQNIASAITLLTFLCMQGNVYSRGILRENYLIAQQFDSQFAKDLPNRANEFQNGNVKLHDVPSSPRLKSGELFHFLQFKQNVVDKNRPDFKKKKSGNYVRKISWQDFVKNVLYESLDNFPWKSRVSSLTKDNSDWRAMKDVLKFNLDSAFHLKPLDIPRISVRSEIVQLGVSENWPPDSQKVRLRRQVTGSNSTPQGTSGSAPVLDTPPTVHSNYPGNATTVSTSSVNANANPTLADEYTMTKNNATQSVIVASLGSSSSTSNRPQVGLDKTAVNKSNGYPTTASGQGNNTNVIETETAQLLLRSSEGSQAFKANSSDSGQGGFRGNVTNSSKISTSISDNVTQLPEAGELPQSTTEATVVKLTSAGSVTKLSAPSPPASTTSSSLISLTQLEVSRTTADQAPSTKSNIATENNVTRFVSETNHPTTGHTARSTTTTAKIDADALSVLPPLAEPLVPQVETADGDIEKMAMSTMNPMAEPDVPFAEPIPDWDVAKKVWKEAWPIHLYLMGTAFALLAFFSLVSIIRLWRIKHLFSQKYFLSLNLLMLIMGVIRAVYLLIDGYNSNKLYPRALDYFLYSTGFPCLTSAFSILFFALLQATRMQLVGPRVQKIQVLLAIIAGHFVISIATDFVVGFFYGAKIMLFLCELISVLWGLFLVIGYCYIFRRLYAAAMKRQRVMERLSTVRNSRHPTANGTSDSNSETRNPSSSSSAVTIKSSQKYTLSLAVKVTLGTALFGFLYIALEIYSMFGVFGVFSQTIPEPWPWWSFEFGLRLVELGMCVTMSYIGTQPFRYVEGEQTSRWCFYCAACRELAHPRCGNQAGNDKLAWYEIDLNLTNSAPSDEPVPAEASRILYRKHSSKQSKSPAKKLLKSPESIQLKVKHKVTHNGYAGNNGCLNGHINPTLESGQDSRPVSMLVYEDGYIRFRNDDELIKAISFDSDIATGNESNAPCIPQNACVDARTCNLGNTGADIAHKTQQTNFNTNCSNILDRGMQTGDGLSNGMHAHGIVNNGFSGGMDSNLKDMGVQTLEEYRCSVPVDRLLFTDGESDAFSASSMRSQSRSNFSGSIEQELQNLLSKKPSFNVEKAKSATNLPAEAEKEFPKSFIFTDKLSHVHTGVRMPIHEAVLQKCTMPTRSMPCSPVKEPLSSPLNKRKLLSRSNSDHLQLIKNASVRTKVYKNAKYLSLSDLELQIKSDDDDHGSAALHGQHPHPPVDPVKLLSSRKVEDGVEEKDNHPPTPAQERRDENENLDQSEC